MNAVTELLHDAVGRVFPAAQLVVVEAFEIAHEASVGDCDRETLFDIASLTKALATTTIAMRLVDRSVPVLSSEIRPGINARLALCHATGLPAWKLLGDGSRVEIVERVRHEPLESAPGSTSVYSDLGFILLGDLLERLGGATLDELFRKEVAPSLEIGFRPPRSERCAPTEKGLRGIVHDENARSLGGVAGHAGLFSHARDVAAIIRSLLRAWHGQGGLVRAETVREFWSSSGIPGSTWCLGWDRPSATGSSAGNRWPREGVGHLGFTGCSIWIDPPRGRAVVLLSNRVHPTRANEAIKVFRPILHDAVVRALDGWTR
jgi:CubicO group peptidase (beta-lactamase class C family)